jgi:NADH-quinone oxidoreductase subunit E
MQQPKGQAMTTTKEDLGLCSNCIAVNHCVLPREPGRPVMHCEEHQFLDKEEIKNIVHEQDDRLGGVIAILNTIQSKYGYLPEPVLRSVALETGRSLVDIYGVATFYSAFSLEPRGRHLVSVCLGTACHVRGGVAVAEEFERQLGIQREETTKDGEFTLKTVACLGACALGPIVVVDGHYFSKVKPSRVRKILAQAKAGFRTTEISADQRIFPVELHCPRCNHSLMDSTHPIDDRPSIRVTVSFGTKHGWLRLSSLYGSYSLDSEYEIPIEETVHFFCPHCHAELTGDAECAECRAPMVLLIVQGGGMVQICSRRGCQGHMLHVNGVNG